MSEQEVKAMWKTQTVTASANVDAVRRDPGAFQRRIGRRNAREFIAAAVLIAWVPYGAMHAASSMFVAGSELTIAGALVVVWQLHRHASRRAPPVEALGLASVAFHRGELERQRDALRNAWLCT